MEKKLRENSAPIEDILLRLWLVTQERLAAVKLKIREKDLRRDTIAQRRVYAQLPLNLEGLR